MRVEGCERQVDRSVPIGEAAAGLGEGGQAVLPAFVQGGFGFGQPGALGGQVAFELDAFARAVLPRMAGQFFASEMIALLPPAITEYSYQ